MCGLTLSQQYQRFHMIGLWKKIIGYDALDPITAPGQDVQVAAQRARAAGKIGQPCRPQRRPCRLRLSLRPQPAP